MGTWLCEIGGQRKGPFDDQQLQDMARDGRLTAADKVWNPAGKRWELAGKLQGLFGPPVAAHGANGKANGANGNGNGADGADGAAEAAAAAASAAMSAAAVCVAENDAGPFLRVGGAFGVANGSQWSGAVVASHSAIYLLKGQIQQAYGLGGITGDLAAAAFGNYDDVRSCTTTQMPPHVLDELDPNRAYPNADVIVLPRDAVTNVKTKLLGSGATVYCGGDAFNLVVSVLGLGSVKSFLSQGGWSVNQEVRPTAPAVHGRGFGRPAGQPNPAEPPALARVGYAVLAVLVFAVIAYFKFQMRRHRHGW